MRTAKSKIFFLKKAEASSCCATISMGRIAVNECTGGSVLTYSVPKSPHRLDRVRVEGILLPIHLRSCPIAINTPSRNDAVFGGFRQDVFNRESWALSPSIRMAMGRDSLNIAATAFGDMPRGSGPNNRKIIGTQYPESVSITLLLRLP